MTVAAAAGNGTFIAAQTVRIESAGETGHGFLIHHAGLCWVILPRHVAGDSRRVTVFSGAPVVHSPALIETPFWEGMDLAIGQLRGAVEERCTAGLPLISGEVRAGTGGEVHLQRLRSSGEVERIPMQITRTDYLTLEAMVTKPGEELFKGSSGAFLFEGDRPIGMITEALTPTEGRFIRIEEIGQNIARRISRQAAPVAAGGGAVSAPEAPDSVGLAFEAVSAILPPLTPDQGEANLTGPGLYAFSLSRPNRIAFRVRGEAAAILSRVRIRATDEEGFAVPRDITVEVAADGAGQRARPFAMGVMGPDGTLELTGAATSARWVYVTIRSAWDEAPVGIDAVSFH
ncbi:hypothetical protein XINFAN_03905 [Pseudogemmobacter humi]|uniref:Uncharacterized protein n=1 Tax=Pseudogemmobacter humi TaxID=2483812 RepID=A0A3P5XT92_9RHOB|nr:hypothetical protein XINFAN_03905 [Pseudogemmobacter humi]